MLRFATGSIARCRSMLCRPGAQPQKMLQRNKVAEPRAVPWDRLPGRGKIGGSRAKKIVKTANNLWQFWVFIGYTWVIYGKQRQQFAKTRLRPLACRWPVHWRACRLGPTRQVKVVNMWVQRLWLRQPDMPAGRAAGRAVFPRENGWPSIYIEQACFSWGHRCAARHLQRLCAGCAHRR